MAAIIKNNLKLLLSSKVKLFVLLILPLLIFVMGRGIGGNIVSELRLAMVNPAQDPLGGVLEEELASMDYKLEDMSREEAKEALLEGKVDGILYIPENLSGEILGGKIPPLELETLKGQQFMEFVRVYTERFLVRANLYAQMHRPGTSSGLAQLLREKEAASTFRVESISVPMEKVGMLLSSGLFVYLLSINMLMVTSLLQREIAWKTLDRIQYSPLRKSHVLLANVLTGSLLLLVNLAAIALLSKGLYGGILPLPYYLVWFVYGLVWLFLGIFLAISISLPAVYTSLSTLLSVLCSMLGGSFVPLFLMTPLLRKLAALTPQYWANEAIRLLGTGTALSALMPNFLALSAFILLFFSLGIFSQRRRKSLARRAG